MFINTFIEPTINTWLFISEYFGIDHSVVGSMLTGCTIQLGYNSYCNKMMPFIKSLSQGLQVESLCSNSCLELSLNCRICILWQNMYMLRGNKTIHRIVDLRGKCFYRHTLYLFMFGSHSDKENLCYIQWHIITLFNNKNVSCLKVAILYSI